MPQLPKAKVVHFTTGRARFKIPEKRGDQRFFETVEKRLAGWDSIERIETTPLTGSVLVHFADAFALFAENALKNDLFSVDLDDLEREKEAAVGLIEWARRQMATFDGSVRNWTAGSADIRGVVFLFLVAASLHQLLRGNISAPATTLLWYAGAMLRLWDVVPEVKQAVRGG